jgi:hypothetical protein
VDTRPAPQELGLNQTSDRQLDELIGDISTIHPAFALMLFEGNGSLHTFFTKLTWRRLARVIPWDCCYDFSNSTLGKISAKNESTMLSTTQNTKFCWICGKDVALEHCLTDEHGLCVHQSCHEKRLLLKAASLKSEQWRQGQSKDPAAA